MSHLLLLHTSVMYVMEVPTGSVMYTQTSVMYTHPMNLSYVCTSRRSHEPVMEGRKQEEGRFSSSQQIHDLVCLVSSH